MGCAQENHVTLNVANHNDAKQSTRQNTEVAEGTCSCNQNKRVSIIIIRLKFALQLSHYSDVLASYVVCMYWRYDTRQFDGMGTVSGPSVALHVIPRVA
jgi:hypothetical protein